MSKVKRRLTAADFAVVRPTLVLMQISEQRIDAARSVMVDGKSLATVAREQGWSTPAVSKTVRRVWEVHETLAKGQSMVAAGGGADDAYTRVFDASDSVSDRGEAVVVLPDDAPDAVVASLVRVALSAAKGAPVMVINQVREGKKKPAR